MRLLLPVLIWIVFVGGLWGYIHQRDRVLENRQGTIVQNIKESDKRVNLYLTPTFSAEKDPFALNLESAEGSELLVRVNGEQVILPSLALEQGMTAEIADLGNLVEGKNELYLEISPPLSDTNISQALRVLLADENKELLDATVWSEGGALLSGSFVFEISEEVEHEH